MEQSASLKWVTPDADNMIVDIARVTNLNPPPTTPENNRRLIKYMADNGHVSPFEMASMCLEIYTPRDIARQILRHRSFSFQEFSYRYSSLKEGMVSDEREIRLKHPTNRQMSVPIDNKLHASLLNEWQVTQASVKDLLNHYDKLIELGAAPETARAVLPEGYTMSRMYMSGTCRSWIFYLKERLNEHTVQKEHYELAKTIAEIFKEEFPIVYAAMFNEN